MEMMYRILGFFYLDLEPTQLSIFLFPDEQFAYKWKHGAWICTPNIWQIMSPNGWYLKHHHFKFRSHGKLSAKNILLIDWSEIGLPWLIFFFSLLPDKFSPHCTAPFLVAWKHVFYSFEVLTKYCANCMSHPIEHNNSQYNNYTTDERIPFTWWSVFPHRGLFVYVD